MRICLLIMLSLVYGVVWAQGVSQSTESRVMAMASPLTGLQLASADGVMSESEKSVSAQSTNQSEPYKSRWFTANKIHKYLGLGSIGAAGLTLLTIDSADEDSKDGGIHETFARTATALGGAAVLTGLIFHWDDFKLSNGLSDPDNLHLLLTTLGTLGYAKAVDQAPNDSHSGYGSLGAASMILGIKMVW